MVTTDFGVNPRFDKPKTPKRSVKISIPESPKRDPSFRMSLRKRERKAERIEKREIKMQTIGILKPDPLKSKFW